MEYANAQIVIGSSTGRSFYTGNLLCDLTSKMYVGFMQSTERVTK